ncbi:MAG: saccharopine dehydrogenase NADP-binding domain-containing protein [Lysobacterales bacterium]|nr:saccharopine dehydrogenase NADP-binding domain-containing protein [Xanthomonadales bacterium]MCP5475155.1 saccharopine dehydrogenase NADP-binding domain-containing protein [Rhodanobacteraceae bacterium]
MAVFKPSWLLYGATGYTGALVAAEARKRGQNVILAGRSHEALTALGKQLDLPIRVFDMAARDQIDRGLTGVRLVLNCAGPFSLTASTLAQACMRTGAHYLDIAGEVADHRGLHRLHERACESGVMLMPGVGFGILPSDCLAFHLKQRQPAAVKLTLAFSAGESASHGTLATLMESLQSSGLVRRAGRLVAAEPASESCTIDFGPGKEQRAILFPWRADVLSAGLSTEIPHIQSFAAVPAVVRFILKHRGWFEKGFLRNLLEKWVARAPAGPTAAERAKRKSWLYGEVVNEVGSRACAVVEGPDPYDFTVIAALMAVERCLSGQVPDGFATPAQILGDAPLRELPGVKLHTLR